jgi:hypothetical protein
MLIADCGLKKETPKAFANFSPAHRAGIFMPIKNKQH